MATLSRVTNPTRLVVKKARPLERNVAAVPARVPFRVISQQVKAPTGLPNEEESEMTEYGFVRRRLNDSTIISLEHICCTPHGLSACGADGGQNRSCEIEPARHSQLLFPRGHDQQRFSQNIWGPNTREVHVNVRLTSWKTASASPCLISETAYIVLANQWRVCVQVGIQRRSS